MYLIKTKYLLFIVLVSIVWFSCQAPPCENSNGVKLNAGFYVIERNVLLDTLVDSLIVFIPGGEANPVINNINNEVSEIKLRLSAVSDTSTFIMMFDSIKYDTVSFIYSSELKLVSHECGFDHYFELDSTIFTNNVIDSVRIRKPLVEYGDEENVKVFF